LQNIMCPRCFEKRGADAAALEVSGGSVQGPTLRIEFFESRFSVLIRPRKASQPLLFQRRIVCAPAAWTNPVP
jgi:hypothetical protein